MKDYVFVTDLHLDVDGTPLGWGDVPNTYWKKLLWTLPELGIDGVGFQDVTDKEGLRRLRSLPADDFNVVEVVAYPAFHIDKPINEVAVFELDANNLKEIATADFEDWGKDNPDLPVDEFAFFQDGKCKVVVVPYENWIFLYGITDDELEALKKVDVNYQSSFYERNNEFKI